MSVGSGRIVSIAIRVIGDTIDRTNRGALITARNGIIFRQVGQHCMKSRTSFKILAINPRKFPQDDMTLIGSEFSKPPNGHSDVHDMP